VSGQEIVYLVLIIVFVLLAALFEGSEVAFISLQKVRLEHLVSTGVKGARAVESMLARPEKFLSAILLSQNIVEIGMAALVTALALSAWGEEGIIIATAATTVVLLIFAQTTPKTFAAQHSEKLALLLVRPLQLLAWLLTPFVAVLSWVAAGLARMFGGPAVRTLANPEEIRNMISVGRRAGTVEEHEARLLHKVFEFADRPVYEVMVPRPEVTAVPEGSTIGDFLKIYLEAPRSRFPVYRESMDNVVGILAVKDVLMALARDAADDAGTIDELIRPAYFAPESKHIDELFTEMREKNYRMAVVVDEYGGTAGIVTLTRLVEEIVGEVGDELAGVEKDYQVINEYTFQIGGSMRIEEANEEMKLGLPEGEDYETVAGFILSLLGHIPRRHEQLRYSGLKMVITEMKGLKIEKILLTKERPPGPSDATKKERRAGARKTPGKTAGGQGGKK
jgi:putative hemolysin